MSAWDETSLGDAIVAGVAAEDRSRIWVHGARGGEVRVRARRGAEVVAEVPLILEAERGCTAATTLEMPGCAGERVELELVRDGRTVARARTRLCPGARAWANQRMTFAVASCHQPFTDAGEVHPASASMLEAARVQVEADDAAFVLLMGDQLYADAPASKSLFDPDYVASLGFEDILDLSAAEVRRVFQHRYERFAGVPGFSRLLASVGTIPMPDDHEFVDNFGTHPDHAGPRWRAFKQGALQAYRDHQGARTALAERPSDSLDYAFTWGPVAVYGLDIRSNRETAEGKTRAYTGQQLEDLRGFLARTADMPVLALMVSIPLVHVSSRWVDAAARVLPLGSDLHERWSHASCVEARDVLLGTILDHAVRNPRQKIILLGGDVHAGSAYQVDFADDGVQLLQLTSSPLSNEEGWLNARAGEAAAQALSSLELSDGRSATVTSLRGRSEDLDRNPYGGLNLGLVDISTDAEGLATIGLRLVGHDGEGRPKTLLDTGPLGRRRDPETSVLGLA